MVALVKATLVFALLGAAVSSETFLEWTKQVGLRGLFAALVCRHSYIAISLLLQHGKEYSSKAEYEARADIFARNLQYIERFNSEDHSYECKRIEDC